MSDWSNGYVADIGYTFGYHAELNPMRMRLPLLAAGLAPPEVATACELGFGQGLGTAIHAAASSVNWWGTDFNPAQAGFAQGLAAAAGSGARLFDQSFAEFAEREDLPDFDFIGLHGVWSWISAENRAILARFIRRRLKVGGVLYISYNTFPGWAQMLPMRNLLAEHARVMTAPGAGRSASVGQALDFAQQLFALDPRFARANPLVVERLAKMQTQPREYLAHEYFNQDWQPVQFSTMAAVLAEAKLSFACSATLHDHVDSLNLAAPQREFLAAIDDVPFRETVRDFMVNQQFRRDYWIKGGRRLSSSECSQTLAREAVVLTVPAQMIDFKVDSVRGEMQLKRAVYEPLVAALDLQRPRTIGELERELGAAGITPPQLLEALLTLGGKGYLESVQDETAVARCAASVRRLNLHLLRGAWLGGDVHFLAAARTGGGVGVQRLDMLFLLAHSEGVQGAAAMAAWAADLLSGVGMNLAKDGVAVAGGDDSLAALTASAVDFVERRLPLCLALGVL